MFSLCVHVCINMSLLYMIMSILQSRMSKLLHEQRPEFTACVSEAGGPQHGSQPSLTECERPPAELILI